MSINSVDQFNQLIIENEELTSGLERLKNENNVLRIEIQEMTLAKDNERAAKELLAEDKEGLQLTIEGLQKDLNELYEELDELNEKYQSQKLKINSVEELTSCSLDEVPNWKQKYEEKCEEAEVFKRELAFFRGAKSFNGLSSVDDLRTERILSEFYKKLNISSQKEAEREKDVVPAPAALEKESVLKDRLSILEEELAKIRAENKTQAQQVKELRNRLAVSKNVIDHLESEVNVYQRHSFLHEQKAEEAVGFKRAVRNLETLDAKLKTVYSSCIDLFVKLDKIILINMEKKLNDCIIEFKEIRNLLLNNL